MEKQCKQIVGRSRADLQLLERRTEALARVDGARPADIGRGRFQVNEKVTFRLAEGKEGGDAEFCVDGGAARRLRLSEIDRFYLTPDGSRLASGLVSRCGEKPVFLAGITADAFARAVEGRKFFIHVRNDMYEIVRDAPRCRELGTAAKIRDFICRALDEGREEDVRGMLRRGTVYFIYEEGHPFHPMLVCLDARRQAMEAERKED